jgi:hypothetical protein
MWSCQSGQHADKMCCLSTYLWLVFSKLRDIHFTECHSLVGKVSLVYWL